MKLSEFKSNLTGMTTVSFQLPDGSTVPAHFHITEVGHVQKRFIDCGGTTRLEDRICFQLWEAEDFDHRLQADKLMKIIELSERTLNLPDEEIEVEYQSATIGKYQLAFNGISFELLTTQTACLAEDKCGIPPSKLKLNLVELSPSIKTTCTPGGGCC
ncbi:MAG: hypothetical protein RLZZ531_440 [Bacteroidota bacterium]|jgi:hypothetical protein